MITLNSYIYENTRNTVSNKSRLEELKKYLKNKSYPDYIEVLNKMLEDPKAKLLLQDGFGGDLGNMKFKFSVKNITANSLRPTQNEIDVEKSLKHSLTKPENIDNDFKEPVIINNMPVVTFRGNYIIDGHHRWAEVAMINPEAKIVCFDYDADISPIQMLKAVQGAIASVVSHDNKDGREIPSNKVEGQNLFDEKWTEKKIKQWCEDTTIEKSLDVLKKHNIDIDTLVERVMSIKYNNYPETGAPNRGLMPQTNKASALPGDKKNTYPDSEGSALNLLKNDK